MRIFNVITVLLLVFLSNTTKSQSTVNAYAKVTSVTGFSVLALSNVDQTNHTFTVGGQVIVMQMQDNVIGTNTTNAATFGNIAGIANAGNYEIRTISAVTPTTGTPTSMTLSSVLSNTYNTGSNSAVQIISYRNLGANFTTTANISGPSWNGNVGGVVAFYVTNTLTLNHRILADGIGFRGGSRSGSAPTDFACVNTSYTSTNTLLGAKGEGIYLPSGTTFSIGRGKIINGGGGGTQNNAGGGGGGNFTAGGQGGIGWTCTSANSGYGLGGIALSGSISASRIFMGGGGGGGQGNGGSTDGGRGGGIILIRATTLATSTTCASSIRVSANGVTATNPGGDGAGGGGAGGSILFQVNNYSVNAACSLTISASAGNGGSVTVAGVHGGGGGGAQGVVIFSTARPTTNVTTQVNNGSAGSDNSGGSVSATAGSGTSGSGTIASVSGPLPVELLYFTGSIKNGKVKLNWETLSEINNKSFLVEKSNNGIDFVTIGKLNGAGTTNLHNHYETYDYYPIEGSNYYRLKQCDFSGEFEYSPIIVLEHDDAIDFTVQPNPADAADVLKVNVTKGRGFVTLTLIDITGNVVWEQVADAGEKLILIDNVKLEKGIYFLKLQHGQTVSIKKVILQ